MPNAGPGSSPLYAGIDLGGTKVLCVIVSASGERLGAAVVPTPSDAPAEEVVAAMAKVAALACSNAGGTLSDIRGAGLAAAGAIDAPNGVIVHSPHLAGFKRTPVASMLGEALDRPVVIGNDANLAALGEYRFGAGQGVDEMIFITISTGIGSGIISGGRLLLGAGGYAGEVGHMSVNAHGPLGKSTNPGAWESLCAGSALVRIITERVHTGEPSSLEDLADSGELTAIHIFDAYRAGDTLTQAVVHEAVRYMGAALTNVVNILNPGLIIIGGGLSNEWADYIAPAVTIMRKQTFAGIGVDTPVIPPALGAESGALGAAALAMESASPA